MLFSYYNIIIVGPRSNRARETKRNNARALDDVRKNRFLRVADGRRCVRVVFLGRWTIGRRACRGKNTEDEIKRRPLNIIIVS